MPIFNTLLELDLATVEPSVAGPRRPQDRVPLTDLKQSFWRRMTTVFNREVQARRRRRPRLHPLGRRGRQPGRGRGRRHRPIARTSIAATRRRRTLDGHDVKLTHGAVVIAAITELHQHRATLVMVAAGLLAKKAVERADSAGLCEDQPGARLRVVTDYLSKAEPDAVPGAARLQHGRLRLHHLHRQQRPAARSDRQRRSTNTTWWSAPC